MINMKLIGRWLPIFLICMTFFPEVYFSPCSLLWLDLSAIFQSHPFPFHITSLHHFLTTFLFFSRPKLTPIPVSNSFLFSFSCLLLLFVPWHLLPEAHEEGMWHGFCFLSLSVWRKNVCEETQSKWFTPSGQDSVLSHRHQWNEGIDVTYWAGRKIGLFLKK